jgi:inner membrane protein
MLSMTHAAFSTTTVALALCTANPGLLIAAAIASQLPDLDTPNSYIGRICQPLSQYISQFGHRQITHSILGTAIAWIVFLPLLFAGSDWYWAVALGYLSGWLLDAASKTGVPIFYPSPKRGVFPLDPEYRIKTGSLTERLFLAILILVLGLTIAMNLSGGAVTSFSNWLGSSSGAVETYHKYANKQEIWARISGSHRITQDEIKEQKFKVIGAASETDLIVTDGQHKYRTGSSQDAQIRPTRTQLDIGRAIDVQIETISIPEPDSIRRIVDVMGANDFVTGELTTDEGDTLFGQSDPRYFAAIAVQHLGDGRASVKLRSASKSDLDRLGEIYVQGAVVARKVK